MIAVNLKETLNLPNMTSLYAAPATGLSNESYVAAHASWDANWKSARDQARREYDNSAQDRAAAQHSLEVEAARRLAAASSIKESLVSGFASSARRFKTKKEVRQGLDDYVSANSNEVFRCIVDPDYSNLPAKPSLKRGPGSSTDLDEDE